MKINSTFLLFFGMIGGGLAAFATPLPPSESPSSVESEVVVPSSIPAPFTPPPAAATPPPPEDLGEEDMTQHNPRTFVPDVLPGTAPFHDDVYPPAPESPADPNALIPIVEETPVLPPHIVETHPKTSHAKEIIRYKETKVVAERNPAIQRMYARAQRAATEEGYRASMREYYRMLFKKIEELEPSLTQKARGMQQAYLRRLAQTRIEPTIPLQPPPTPESLDAVSN